MPGTELGFSLHWGLYLGSLPHQFHSLLTGLHEFNEVREKYIPVPLTEAADIIGYLEVGKGEG